MKGTIKLFKYPFDKWFSRIGVFRLERGIHYKCATHAMAVQLRTAAWKRNMKLSVLIDGDVLTVCVTERNRANA